MDNSEKLCLTWNNFEEHQKSSFAELRNDTDLTNVTLAFDDGKQVEVHKVVLATSSNFFMEILKRNKHTHPLIYLRGLKSHDMSAILDFIYCGEAKVYQENIDAFLALAEDLKLKGIRGDESGAYSLKRNAATIKEETKSCFEEAFQLPINDQPESDQHYLPQEYSAVKTANLNLHQLNEQVKSMMKLSGNMIFVGKIPRKARICKVCGKEGEFGNIQKHIEANHISGANLPCDICGKVSRSRSGLRQHKTSNHEK